LEVEENEEVVRQALGSTTSFKMVPARGELNRLAESGELVWPDLEQLTQGDYLRTIPGVQPCDGFFAAVLERTR
jgi:16S rRNA (cytosine967-C5)-methyltransferase